MPDSDHKSTGATDLLDSNLVIDHTAGRVLTVAEVTQAKDKERQASRLSDCHIIVEPTLFQDGNDLNLETFVKQRGGTFRRMQASKSKVRSTSTSRRGQLPEPTRSRVILVIPIESRLSPDVDRSRLLDFSRGDIQEWYQQHGLDPEQLEIHTDEYIFRLAGSEPDEPILDALPHLGLSRGDARQRIEYFARLALQFYADNAQPVRGSIGLLQEYIRDQSSISSNEKEVKWGTKGVRRFFDNHSALLDSLVPVLTKARYSKDTGVKGGKSASSNKRLISTNTKPDIPRKRVKEESMKEEPVQKLSDPLRELASLAAEEKRLDVTDIHHSDDSSPHAIIQQPKSNPEKVRSSLDSESINGSLAGTTHAAESTQNRNSDIAPGTMTKRHISLSISPALVSSSLSSMEHVIPDNGMEEGGETAMEGSNDQELGDSQDAQGLDETGEGGEQNDGVQEQMENGTSTNLQTNLTNREGVKDVLVKPSDTVNGISTPPPHPSTSASHHDPPPSTVYVTPTRTLHAGAITHHHPISPRTPINARRSSNQRIDPAASTTPSRTETAPSAEGTVRAPDNLIGNYILRGSAGARWLYAQLTLLLNQDMTALLVPYSEDEAVEAESVLVKLEGGWWIPNLSQDLNRMEDPDYQNLVDLVDDLAEYMKKTEVQDRLNHQGDIFRSWPGPPDT